MEKKYIYLDNAATTKTDPEVVKAMEPYFTEHYGIPGSDLGHSFDMKAIEALESSRKIIAENSYRMIFSSEPDPDIERYAPRLVDQELFRQEQEMWKKWHEENTLMEANFAKMT